MKSILHVTIILLTQFLVSEILSNEEELLMTIITDQSEFLISIGDSLSNPKGTIFKTKDKVIKFGLFKGKEYLGMGEFLINNEVRWVAILNSSPKKQHTNEISNLCDSLRLRIKCSPNGNIQKAGNHIKPQYMQSSDGKQSKKSTPQFDIQLLSKDKNNNSMSKINHDTSYIKNVYGKSKTGRISKHRSHNYSCNNILNTDIYSLYNTSNSKKLNIKKDLYNKTKGSYRDLRSLSAFNSNTRTEYRTHSTQKQFKKINLSVSQQDTKLACKIINKSFEKNIEKDEIICSTDNELMSIAPLEDYECSIEPFSALKEDFFILYEDGYLTQVLLDTIQLETELFIEKVSEMQRKYHHIIKELNTHFVYYNSKAKELNELLMVLTKKRNKLRLFAMENEYYQMIKESKTNSHSLIKLAKDELSIWHQIMKDSTNQITDICKRKGERTKKMKLKDIILILFNKGNQQDRINKLNVYQKYFLEKIMQNVINTTKTKINNQQKASIYNETKAINLPKENINTILNQYSAESNLTKMNSTMTHSTTRITTKKKGIKEVGMKKAKSKYLFLSKYKYN